MQKDWPLTPQGGKFAKSVGSLPSVAARAADVADATAEETEELSEALRLYEDPQSC